jgi:ADP-heptose:LPS heptosyltransferase
MLFLGGAPVRVGPADRARSRLYTITVHDDGSPKTAIDFHNRYLRAIGIEPEEHRTEIHLTDDEKREARIYLQWLDHEDHPLDLSKPLVGIHPGASWPAKRWLPERFGQLTDLIRARTGADIILTAGNNDGETIREVLRNSMAPVKVLTGLPLRQLAAVIGRCKVFVSNDAGPMHIAAALGVPTIGLFGPGEENIWFPYSAEGGNVALRRDVPCHPCHLDVCNRSGDDYMECMKLLSVEEVFCEIEKRTLRSLSF